MKALFPIAASCLLGGGAVGYFLGNQKEAPAESVDKTTVSSGITRTKTVNTIAIPKGPDGGRASTYAEVTAAPGQMARLQGLIELYSGLSNEAYAEEADKLSELPFNERILGAYLLFAAWAEVDPLQAFDHANSKMGRTGMFVRPTILQSWAASDPGAAASYYESNKGEFAMMAMMGGRRGGGSAAGTIAAEWAKQDPEGALTWAKSLKGREKNQATSKIIAQIAASDPVKASEMLTGLGDDQSGRAYESVASQWATKDWAATENWVNSLPAGQRGDAMSAAVRSLATKNPTLAAGKALAIPEGEARDEAIESVAESMARDNPVEAVEWVMTNGSEEAQSEAIGDVVSSWVGKDRDAAREWVSSQPEGEVRDSAVSSYVMNDHTGSASEQVGLAESINDDHIRERTVGAAALRWMAQDREAATAYLESSEAISDWTRERVIRRADGGGRRGR